MGGSDGQRDCHVCRSGVGVCSPDFYFICWDFPLGGYGLSGSGGGSGGWSLFPNGFKRKGFCAFSFRLCLRYSRCIGGPQPLFKKGEVDDLVCHSLYVLFRPSSRLYSLIEFLFYGQAAWKPGLALTVIYTGSLLLGVGLVSSSIKF